MMLWQRFSRLKMGLKVNNLGYPYGACFFTIMGGRAGTRAAGERTNPLGKTGEKQVGKILLRRF
jgi:hypothetical protein